MARVSRTGTIAFLFAREKGILGCKKVWCAPGGCGWKPGATPEVLGETTALSAALFCTLVILLAEALMIREMLTGILERISRLRLAPG